MKKISRLIKLDLPLVLASKSPRRRKLLTQIGLKFDIIPSSIDESKIKYKGKPADYAERLALEKARHVASSLSKRSIVIGSDTIVVLDEKVLNKPKDEKDAARMIRTLSGRTHVVFTGIAIIDSGTGQTYSSFQKTEVTFRNLEDEEIEAYIETGSPMDKAGAYGIQDDFGAVFVSHVNGCYYNIVGLPLEMLYSGLKTFVSESKRN